MLYNKQEKKIGTVESALFIKFSGRMGSNEIYNYVEIARRHKKKLPKVKLLNDFSL